MTHAATHTRVASAPVPPELRSTAYTVKINGAPIDVAHAAANYDYATFDFDHGPADIEITAAEPGFWDRGVDIEPWRLGLRATRDHQTIRFRLDHPAKLSISRPRDFLNQAKMLFLFAATPPPPAPRPDPNVKIYGPGIYREGITATTGQTIYLAPGSYFYGGVNLWQVDHVRIYGRGTFIYDGPQDPTTDEGWMHKRDWHCIVVDEGRDIEVHGLTCIVRSRTWSIQMKDSDGLLFDDLRVIGGNPGNANQDGMDWIGSSNGLVRNSFFRASDDDIALMGNWDGYTDADMVRPGKVVHDITIEDSQLSTSISNIVRAGWPKKIFNSWNFTLRNSDILHAGIGACGQTFGLIGFWGANGSRGDHNNFRFENLWLDNWYSLAQMEQQAPSLRNFTFKNIWALDQPPLVGSNLRGNITGTVFDNVKYGQKIAATNADVPLAADTPQPVAFKADSGAEASFSIAPPVIAKDTKVTFTARPTPHAKYTWRFGDGSTAEGRVVHHTFTDADGTDLDARNGAGRFRVMLRAVDKEKKEDWASQGVVVVARWFEPANPAGDTTPGLAFHIYPDTWAELPDFTHQQPVLEGSAPNLNANAQGYTRYAAVWDGFIDIPADGGYTFHLMDRDGARVVIDGVEIARTGPPFPQVCGSPGNAVRYDRGALGLHAGKHTLHVEQLHQQSDGPPRLLWEGPSLPLTDVPSAAFSQQRHDTVRGTTR
ncbi:MAG TPA: PA14 domain-containing protein [Terracidiphilus sp.]